MTMIDYAIVYPIIWFSMLSLSLALVRIKIPQFWAPIALSLVPLTCISLTIQYSEKIYLITIVQPVCLLLCLIWIFRFRWFHACFILVLVYVYGLLQEFISTMVLTRFDLVQTNFHISGDDLLLTAYWLPISNILFCGLLQKFRLGFSFVPRPHMYLRSGNKIPKHFLLASLPSVLLIAVTSVSIVFYIKIYWMVFCGLLVAWVVIIRWAYDKEMLE